ncbi:MAG: hypothetical protein ACHQ49_07345 [Elusimicrobiota bacterium]
MIDALGRASRRSAAVLGLLAACGLGVSAEQSGPYEAASKNENSAVVWTPERSMQDWPERSRLAARLLMVKYGAPASYDDASVTWYGNGQWLRSVVYRDAPPSAGAADVLEQTIVYLVPDEKAAALKRFDGRVQYDKVLAELSVRSSSEDLNFLAMNLAIEIVNDVRKPADARAFYRKTIELAASGKSSRYTESLLFPIVTGWQTDDGL